MKYLKKFNSILESFSSEDLNDLLHDIRDYGLKVTIKEGWVRYDKISTTDIEFNYVNTMPYIESLKTYFINIWGYLEHEDLSNFFSDMQELKDRSEDVGIVDLIYEIESYKENKEKIIFRGDFRLISDQKYDSNFLDEYKKILINHGYKVMEHPTEDWRNSCFEVVLPDPNIPKLSKPKSEMSREEKEERMKLIKKLKYEPWDKARKDIKNILDPIVLKNNMTMQIHHREAFGKMDVIFSPKYSVEEED